MAVGKRLRFEVLKRDGFRCRYCGLGTVATLLHVDHVVPVAEGGSDAPENLITACAECNLGKGPVSLDESRLPRMPSLEDLREHADQIREYVEAHRLIEQERGRLVEFLAEQWQERIHPELLQDTINRFRRLSMQHPIERLLRAMDATGRKQFWASGDRLLLEHSKYFHGVLRKMREEESA